MTNRDMAIHSGFHPAGRQNVWIRIQQEADFDSLHASHYSNEDEKERGNARKKLIEF